MNCRIRNMRIIVVVCIAGVLLAGAARAAAPADAKARREREAKLIETLKGSAPRAEKDKACRELQIIGTPACIPTLAALLADKDLSHMARCALEPMPYGQAAKALRDALPKTSGLIKVGVISSLGYRRDKEAVGELTKSLKDRDTAVAGAAAAALGRIGTPEAAKALDKFRAGAGKALQAVAAEASLTAAQRLLAQGDKEQAAAIYEALQTPKWPKHVRLGAFTGLLVARPTEGVGRVTKAIAGDDPALRGAAIAAIPAMKAPGVAERFAAELPKLPADAQVLLIGVLAERADAAVRPAIVTAAGSANPKVRTAAVKALGTVGDAGCVEILCKAVVEGKSDEEKQVAAVSLQRLRGEGVDAALVKFMKTAPVGARPAFIKALMARKAAAAVGDLLAEAKGQDEGVRRSAFRALGVLAGPKDLPALLKLLAEQKDDTTRKDAERAVMQVSRKISDPAGQADAALAALPKAAAAPAKCSLLRVLGGIANAKALEAVRGALKDKDTKVQEAAVVALAGWPDAAAAPALLKVAREVKTKVHQILAISGYIRLAGELAKAGKTAEAMKMFGSAASAAERPEEKKLILGAMRGIRTIEALNLAVSFVTDAAVAREAGSTALELAKHLARGRPMEVSAAMEKVVASCKDKGIVNQAKRYIKKTPGARRPAGAKG